MNLINIRKNKLMDKITASKWKQKLFNIFIGSTLLLSGFPALADTNKEPLISVIISRSGTVSYISMSPLHYEAKQKDMSTIKMLPGIDPNRKSDELKPMQLIIYSTCDSEDQSVLGLRPKFLHSSLLLSPHPDDRLAAYYLLPTGLFRMLKEAIRGHPYFKEEGIIEIPGTKNAKWLVNITRSDITATNSKTDYFIKFSNTTDQPLFIQAVKLAAKPVDKIPQVTILLKSPRLYVKATYALIYKGSRNYQTIKSISIIDWWNKQQKWCPRKK